MKTLRLIGLLSAILISVGEARAQVGAGANLLTNGGFEDGFTGWSPDVRHKLAEEPGVAHDGSTCVTGELLKPDQALFLKRDVRVRAGNRYNFEIWAKGTKGTKLVLWATQPGSTQRAMVASWPDLTAKWRRYRSPLTVTKSGFLKLDLISPSSHGAEPGRIWVDDVSLIETEMPPLVSASEHQGFSDDPAMAVAADGTAYVAFNRFIDGADTIQIVRYRPSSDGLDRIGQWQVAESQGTYILGINATASDNGIAVAYAAEKKGNWDVNVVICAADGPSTPLTVANDAAVDIKPDIAWHNKKLWVTWESNRNQCRQIFAASVTGGKVSELVPLSAKGSSSYGPSVTVLSDGEVCVAWHGFQKNNYDLFLSRLPLSGKWTKPQRLTLAPTVDRHAFLFSQGKELWVAYENAQTELYHTTRTNRRHLIVAQITPKGLLTPVFDGRSPLLGRCEAGCAAFDEKGRLWLSMLQPRLPRAGWDVFLTGFCDGRWLTPIPVSGSKGMDRTPSLAIRNEQAILAFQADNMPQSWSDLDKMADSTSDIYLASIRLGAIPGSGQMELKPLVESKEPFEPAEIRVQRGEDNATPNIQYQGKTLHLYFGDLHEHSDVSVCNRVGDQSIDESYQHMRDLSRHDFACITDHGYNINRYLWNYSAKLARANDDPNQFLTFLGEEWTSTFEETSAKHPYGFYGHRNLILADMYFPTWWNARNRQTPAQVWDDLRRMKANFVHIPHQLADTGNVPTDWDFHDNAAQPVAEIFQTRGSYEYFGTPRQAKRTVPGPGSFLQDAWSRGLVIGVIASPDHGGGYGKACVFAPELSREAILDALRARHCYGTTAAKIFLDVRVNGHLMGETTTQPPGKSVKVEIRANCPAPIDRIEICRNNQFVYATEPEGTRAQVTFVDEKPVQGPSYYYVRLIQEDEEIAWTSPVWFGADSSSDTEKP